MHPDGGASRRETDGQPGDLLGPPRCTPDGLGIRFDPTDLRGHLLEAPDDREEIVDFQLPLRRSRSDEMELELRGHRADLLQVLC